MARKSSNSGWHLITFQLRQLAAATISLPLGGFVFCIAGSILNHFEVLQPKIESPTLFLFHLPNGDISLVMRVRELYGNFTLESLSECELYSL